MRRTRTWNEFALIPRRPPGSLLPGVRPEVTIYRMEMKEFYCGAIIHGCETRLAARSEDELLAKAHAHAWNDHGIPEVSAPILDEIRLGARTVARSMSVPETS
jgi:predicted small metal-binding protein